MSQEFGHEEFGHDREISSRADLSQSTSRARTLSEDACHGRCHGGGGKDAENIALVSFSETSFSET
jgi:hypothetical protein